MSEAVKANGFPLVTALPGLFALLTDSSGNLSRANPQTVLVPYQSAIGMDAESLGQTTTGIMIYTTDSTTQNLPEDTPSKYGILIVVSFGSTNALLLFASFSSPSRIYSRQKFSGTWREWQRLV